MIETLGPKLKLPRTVTASLLDFSLGFILGAALLLAWLSIHPTTRATDPIPATDADGSVWWVCATQPREYTTASGDTLRVEVDHYLQRNPCPKNPIP